jgi:hypothetical protein
MPDIGSGQITSECLDYSVSHDRWRDRYRYSQTSLQGLEQRLTHGLAADEGHARRHDVPSAIPLI